MDNRTRLGKPIATRLCPQSGPRWGPLAPRLLQSRGSPSPTRENCRSQLHPHPSDKRLAWTNPRLLRGIRSEAMILEVVITPPPPILHEKRGVSELGSRRAEVKFTYPAIRRAVMSCPMLVLTPHNRVPVVNMIREVRWAHRRPTMSASRPYKGVNVALARSWQI